MSEALSTTILREQGPMDLCEVTAATAKRMGWSLLYADVDAVLEREQAEGRVILVTDADDHRRRTWRAS